ncbi:MAG: hypothetical protein WC394_04770 [Candidatus Omnitrophota bacterium]|jgi:hypothetical protein
MKKNRDLLGYLCKDFIWEMNIFQYYFDVAIAKEKQLEVEVDNERLNLINRLSINYDDDDDCEHCDGDVVAEKKKDVWLKAVENVIGNEAYPPYVHVPFIVGGFCTIMFHSFERLLESIFIKYLKKDIKKLFNSRINKKRLTKFLKRKNKPDYLSEWKEICPSITKSPCFSKLEELNLVCNVFKHGRGDSYNKLKLIRPGLFRFHKQEVGYLCPSKGWDLILTENDFKQYFIAIKLFLKELQGYNV